MNFLIKFIILVYFILCSYLFFLPQQVQVLVQKWRKDHFSGGYRLILSWYQYIGLIGMIACLILFHCDFWWTGGLFPAFRLARSVRKFFKKKNNPYLFMLLLSFIGFCLPSKTFIWVRQKNGDYHIDLDGSQMQFFITFVFTLAIIHNPANAMLYWFIILFVNFVASVKQLWNIL